jgi:catechol 2,3-dioxygenase-like lactoylglutathione lyase family enzyme
VTGDDPFPFGPLVYLYMGCVDTAKELAFYDEALGADLVWRFQAFDADVAAVRIGTGPGPLVVLADHRPVPSCLPIYAVRSLEACATWLQATGWSSTAKRVGVPDGPCIVLQDRSGNELALLQQDRPDAMTNAFADATNSRAVRPS